LIGGELLYRGATGHCPVYQTLGVTSEPRERRTASIPYRQGIRVDQSITVNCSPSEMYEFWRKLENLPHFLDRVLSVTPVDDKRSHWVVKGPTGKQVAWDAEIINDIPDQMIAWRSLPGSDVDTAGSVRFNPAPGGRGTEVTVELQYLPPGGIASALLAKLFGEEPEQQVREDLRRLKQLVEAGEIPTTDGQPQGAGRPDLSQRVPRRREQERESPPRKSPLPASAGSSADQLAAERGVM
jgi:uncharacterized membrane protein